MTNIIKIKRKPRPLQKTYQPDIPYSISRKDDDDGTIRYLIFDDRPETYRFVCETVDYEGENQHAKQDAELIIRGLNMLVQYGIEKLP